MSEEPTAYSREAGCSRTNAAYFIDCGVPADYVRGMIGLGTAVTTRTVVDFHKKGIDPEYASSCISLGVKQNRIPALWKSGVPVEYVKALYGG